MLLANKILTTRKRAGYTQQQVADHLGITRSAVTKWESDNPKQRAAPEREQLKKYAELVRTPVGFFLDDTLSVEDMPPLMGPLVALQSAPSKPSIAYEHRAFWDEVTARLPASVRAKIQVSPKTPDWQRPIAPDLLSARTAVRLITHPRPYSYVFANDLAALVAYERSQAAFLRLVGMFYLPSTASAELRDRFDEMQERVHQLADSLKVTYIQVASVEEAVDYLVQLL